jgi:hypothetical protein
MSSDEGRGRCGRLTEVMGFEASVAALRSTSECIPETREERERAERSLGKKRERKQQPDENENLYSARPMLRLVNSGMDNDVLVVRLSLRANSFASSRVPPRSPRVSTIAHERTSSDGHSKLRSRGSRTHPITAVAIRPCYPRRQRAHSHCPRLGHRPET